jgi:hypothetical protein
MYVVVFVFPDIFDSAEIAAELVEADAEPIVI